MVFKAIILLTCLVSAHAAIQCRTGAGVSAGSHDAGKTINYSDCDEGVTQCKLSGKKAVGLAAYTYGCGEKGPKKPDGCKTGTISVDCYCTGDKCKHCNPTDKKDESCKKTNSTIIECRSGVGFSVLKKDAKATKYTKCEAGVTQCKLSGKTAAGVAAYTYSCGEKDKKKADGCKKDTISVNCYCTGSKCKHCNPTDKKDKSCKKTKKNSANTIGTQATIGFALFLAFFSKIMA